MTDDQTRGLWVSTDPLPDGSYGIVVSLDGDRAWPMTRGRAHMYAMAALAIAEQADYEQALYRQLTQKMDQHRDAALMMLANFRHGAQAIDRAAFAPLDFVGGINSAGDSFVRIDLDGKGVGQISPEDLRQHALAVLRNRLIAPLDALYRRQLTEVVGLDDQTAQVAVNDLAHFRPPEPKR
jgi:hypothetical protein